MKKDKPIKICFLADKHDLYDDRIYWKTAVPLKERGFEVHYLLISDRNKKGITNEGIHYEILKLKTFSTNQYLNFILKNLNPNNNYKKLYLKAKVISCDIYHIHDLWINRIGVKLKKLSHKPVVFYDARDPYAEDYKSYSTAKGLLKKCVIFFANMVDKWEKTKAKNYDLIISNEEIVKDFFIQYIGQEKVKVLYNYTDNYKLYSKKALNNKKYDFIYSGGITELRGAFKILEATLIAKKTLPNLKVIFVGKYSPSCLKNEMQKFIDLNDLSNHVELHPFVNYNEISNYYNNSKIGFITPFPESSFKIKMYIKIFEYMAFSLPIIGSDFGHIKEYLEKDKCGILVNPLSEVEIANSMIKLIIDNELYQRLSENGRKATLKKYRWELELEKLISYYSKALENRSL